MTNSKGLKSVIKNEKLEGKRRRTEEKQELKKKGREGRRGRRVEEMERGEEMRREEKSTFLETLLGARREFLCLPSFTLAYCAVRCALR
jgi:hypothetical protein